DQVPAPRYAAKRRQQLHDREPGDYESQRGPAPGQEGALVGERKAGIRFRFAAGLAGSGGGVTVGTPVMRLVPPPGRIPSAGTILTRQRRPGRLSRPRPDIPRAWTPAPSRSRCGRPRLCCCGPSRTSSARRGRGPSPTTPPAGGLSTARGRAPARASPPACVSYAGRPPSSPPAPEGDPARAARAPAGRPPAVIPAPAPADTRTGPRPRANERIEPLGLPASRLGPTPRGLLGRLVALYLDRLPIELAARRLPGSPPASCISPGRD